jgi:hypothetical protein
MWAGGVQTSSALSCFVATYTQIKRCEVRQERVVAGDDDIVDGSSGNDIMDGGVGLSPQTL